MDIRRFPLKELTSIAVRLWLAFSLPAFVCVFGFSVLDGENPLRSDDPYGIGFIAGGIGVMCALHLTCAGSLDVSNSTRRVAYFLPLATLAATCVTWDVAFPPIEGQGLPTFFAIVITVSGLLAYLVHRQRLTKSRTAVASVPGLLLLVAYSIVAMRIVN